MNINHPVIMSVWSALLLLLSGCSSMIPPDIRQPLENSPNVTQAREQIDAHVSKQVRWGGIILNTENHQKGSRIKVISLPLTSSGKPEASDKTSGRFIAEVDEFLEPLVYERDRRITVKGHIIRSESIKVGDFLYEYPVVKVDKYYLWPKKHKPVNTYYHPYWRYDPLFYPDYYLWPYPTRLNHYYR